MPRTIQIGFVNSKADTEPRELIIHSPCVTQRSAWNDWARATVSWLTENGWRASRIGHRVHIRPNFLEPTVH